MEFKLCFVALVAVLYNACTLTGALQAVADFDSRGKIVFDQENDKSPVKVTVDFKELQQAKAYHVHEKKVGTVAATKCKDTGGHWNPTSKAYPCTDNSDMANCEAGDLSGKHKFIDPAESTFKDSYEDSYITLYGEQSIMDKMSVVIHKDDADASRWICADILKSRAAASQHISIVLVLAASISVHFLTK